ncbi:MAG: DUF2325 domain-containing protein [Lachnospiraceae bacterium]
MCVVIIGGNECMVRKYKDLCREYRCEAKVYPKQKSSLKGTGCKGCTVTYKFYVSTEEYFGRKRETEGLFQRRLKREMRERKHGNFLYIYELDKAQNMI